jgi:branched-subunit amino acid aminotransferase/4-amino-4-deoxychorismate lyase
MNRSNYCYFNGELKFYDQMHIHISDLLFQRGYGIFDFFRIRKGRIPWFEDYAERLYGSLERSGIEVDIDREQFSSIIHELQKKNNMSEGAFKVIVTGGYSETLDSVTGPANLMILNVKWQRPPAESFENGVGLIREQYVRPNPEIKTLYYFNTLRLRKKLKAFDAADVMFHTDTITEASRANLFFVSKGEVHTPGRGILRGITRKQVIAMFKGIRVEDIGFDRLHEFDEIFMTGTSRDVTPVVSVEGKKIGNGRPGPVTREIQSAYSHMGW